MSPSAARPTVCSPASWYEASARDRFTARATGIRAAAPALVRQADAVMPTARRWGTTTPCASNAAAERTTAPRVRGVVGRDLQTDALVQRPLGHPVELGLAHLEQRQPAVRGQREGLGDPLV